MNTQYSIIIENINISKEQLNEFYKLQQIYNSLLQENIRLKNERNRLLKQNNLLIIDTKLDDQENLLINKLNEINNNIENLLIN